MGTLALGQLGPTTAAGRALISAANAAEQRSLIGVDALASAISSDKLSRAANIGEMRALLPLPGHRLFVEGYWITGGGGHGFFYWDSTDTTTPHNGGTVFTSTHGSNPAGRWKRIVDKYCTPKDFGAMDYDYEVTEWEDAPDSTAAIQALMDWSMSAFKQNRIRWEGRGYLISASIVITGGNVYYLTWEWEGACFLIQSDTDAPIFEFATTGLVHSSTFRAQATWTTLGDGTQINRAFFYYPNTGSDSWMNNDIQIMGDRCHYAIKVTGPHFWGNRISMNLNRGVTGGLIYFYAQVDEPDVGGGPNNLLHHTYAVGDMAGPLIDSSAIDLEYFNVEINAAFLGPSLVRDYGGGDHIIHSMRVEGFQTTAPVILFDTPNSSVTIHRFSFDGDVCNIDHETRLIVCNNALKRVVLGRIKLDPQAIGSSYMLIWGDNSGVSRCTLQELESTRLGLNVFFTDIVATASGNTFEYQPLISHGPETTHGDVSVTLTHLSSVRHRFETPLTADRVVTLPNVASFLAFLGRPFEIVKAVTGGALDVGGIASFTAGQTGRIRVRYRRYAWVLDAKEIW